MIKDLQAEAIFFGQTIAEAAEGLVEIREDYIEDSHKGETKSELEGILMSHPSIEDAAVVPNRSEALIPSPSCFPNRGFLDYPTPNNWVTMKH
ncbi:uncharacterized protein [Arachis hypogaea]|uniref:uncharacterized protein isoform X3 n=1 Tax=Arachis hypogaea TaxID=3818 RepID=UPI003B211E9F